MEPVQVIAGILASIKTAGDIAKLLINADASLETAELKLKLAELVVALANAKGQIVDIKELVSAKDETIKQLQEALAFKGKVVQKDLAYWETDEEGKTVDGPFCTRCFDVERVVCRLLPTGYCAVRCPNCKTAFSSRGLFYQLRPNYDEEQRMEAETEDHSD